MTSISTFAPLGSAATWIVERAGKFSVKNFAYTSFIPAKSARFVMNTVAFHNVGEGELLVVENGFHVFQHAFSLRFDVANDEAAVRRADRNLAGAKSRSPMRTAWL